MLFYFSLHSIRVRATGAVANGACHAIATPTTQQHVDHITTLNVEIAKPVQLVPMHGLPVDVYEMLQLHAREDETLLERLDTFLHRNHVLNVVDRVARVDVQRERFARQTAETQIEANVERML